MRVLSSVATFDDCGMGGREPESQKEWLPEIWAGARILVGSTVLLQHPECIIQNVTTVLYTRNTQFSETSCCEGKKILFTCTN